MPTDPAATRDHGGRLDAAVALYGGDRAGWIDLSTGINPVPYPLGDIPPGAWTDLPDQAAAQAFVTAARRFWRCPEGAALIAVPGLSSVIAQIPYLSRPGSVRITQPTYNEHAASFEAAGWQVVTDDAAKARVVVHPNNPDGRWFTETEADAPLCVIDESFCDIAPDRSLVHLATRPGTLVLKSFGKFWGLAGLRLGAVMGDPELVAKLAARLGPWPVSGPALDIGRRALTDLFWPEDTTARLTADALRLDTAMQSVGATLTGGTPLFRLYDHPEAEDLHHHLAAEHIWTRTFPWSATVLRLGLPAPDDWPRVEAAIAGFA
ncbi:threonine-phosphate decarboxylase [Pseudooceanicola onchidii]|uniref:threonine-phosphate decarboxylase n=1 Tax=Pseudooceanicola onchidii TaxID=2562279 RepID=UPI0010AAE9D9|nr:threonine-phosphate decarboxylase [Pseudooceanicola onchidii]